jgi:Transposase, Mutator family
MSARTRTQRSSETELDVATGLEPGERFAGGERSEPGGRAQRSAGEPLRATAAGSGRELPAELVDDALKRARVRSAVGELSGGGRLSDAAVDELLQGASSEEEIVGPGGLLAQLTKRLVERALEVELTDHLGYAPHEEPPGGTGNTRNGSTPKTLITDNGPVAIDTPRDRNGSFEPRLVKKRQRRFQGFDDKILALYSRGLSTRDIEAHLQEIYGVRVGRDLIRRVSDAVMEDARAW